jgi:MEDS: MEthanogen/methylotroph, DcmR Sensory domain
MRRAWTEFLVGPESGHAVQIYSDAGELAESVSAYVAAGFEAAEPALLVATPELLDACDDRLTRLGWDPVDARDRGLLTVGDAAATLESILDGGVPSAERFEAHVGTLLQRLAGQSPTGQTRVFGEMVDLLVQRDQLDAAIALEDLWNAAAQAHRFSLLCGYRLDVFDRDSQATALPHVCGVHSHVLPAHNYARFSSAVDRALDEVLGRREAGKLYVVLASEIREERVPLAQLILMWVSANMPSLADRILESARTHYLRPAAARS